MALSERDQRLAIIAGGAVGALLLVFLLLKVLGGGGEEALPPIGPPVGTGGPAVSPSASPTGGPQPVLVFSGRDPFSPPPILSSPSSSASPSSSPSPSPTSSIPSHREQAASTVVGDRTVTLLDASVVGGVEQVNVTVDERSFTDLVEGDQFGGGFELSTISGDCATFLYPNGSFTLCLSGS